MKILAALIITLHCHSDRLTTDVCVSTHLGWCQGRHTAHSFGSFCFFTTLYFQPSSIQDFSLKGLGYMTTIHKGKLSHCITSKNKMFIKDVNYLIKCRCFCLTSELTTLILFDIQQPSHEAGFLSS